MEGGKEGEREVRKEGGRDGEGREVRGGREGVSQRAGHPPPHDLSHPCHAWGYRRSAHGERLRQSNSAYCSFCPLNIATSCTHHVMFQNTPRAYAEWFGQSPNSMFPSNSQCYSMLSTMA